MCQPDSPESTPIWSQLILDRVLETRELSIETRDRLIRVEKIVMTEATGQAAIDADVQALNSVVASEQATEAQNKTSLQKIEDEIAALKAANPGVDTSALDASVQAAKDEAAALAADSAAELADVPTVSTDSGLSPLTGAPASDPAPATTDAPSPAPVDNSAAPTA